MIEQINNTQIQQKHQDLTNTQTPIFSTRNQENVQDYSVPIEKFAYNIHPADASMKLIHDQQQQNRILKIQKITRYFDLYPIRFFQNVKLSLIPFSSEFSKYDNKLDIIGPFCIWLIHLILISIITLSKFSITVMIQAFACYLTFQLACPLLIGIVLKYFDPNLRIVEIMYLQCYASAVYFIIFLIFAGIGQNRSVNEITLLISLFHVSLFVIMNVYSISTRQGEVRLAILDSLIILFNITFYMYVMDPLKQV